MKVRRLKKEERLESAMISAFCFHRRGEGLESKREQIENDPTDAWGAFTEDGILAGRMVDNHYQFYIDGTPVKAGGIGGVATLPEYRNTGAIREIFRALLPTVYREGEVLSTLYPFNHAFYRKQGYDTVTYRNVYELEPAFLEHYKTDCKAIAWRPGDNAEEYLSVYQAFIRDFNLPAVRDEACMREHIAVEEIFQERKFTYLFQKEERSLAYLIFEDVKSEPQATLRVEEVAWVNPEGFEAILAFLGRFDADYGKISLSLPYGIDLYRILRTRRAYDVGKETEISYMVRAVNVQKLLEVIRKPADCDFTVSVQDDIIQENNATFRVTAAAVIRVGEEADLTLGEPTFAQLAVGANSMEEAMLKPDCKVRNKEEMLKRVFTEKKLFINEHF